METHVWWILFICKESSSLPVLRLINTHHAVPMPRACLSHAIPCRLRFILCLSHLIYTVRPCLIHTCHAAPMPRACRSESDFLMLQHSAAWAWHGMCELASAVQRRHVGDLLAFSFFRLPRGVPRRLLSESYQSVKM
jgi:hypothetical protein